MEKEIIYEVSSQVSSSRAYRKNIQLEVDFTRWTKNLFSSLLVLEHIWSSVISLGGKEFFFRRGEPYMGKDFKHITDKLHDLRDQTRILSHRLAQSCILHPFDPMSLVYPMNGRIPMRFYHGWFEREPNHPFLLPTMAEVACWEVKRSYGTRSGSQVVG